MFFFFLLLQIFDSVNIYTTAKKIPRLLLFLEFEKAFNILETKKLFLSDFALSLSSGIGESLFTIFASLA